MKYHIILKITLLVLVIQLTSCKNEKEKVKKAAVHNEKMSVSDTIFDSENPYYKFIQKNNPDALKDNKLVYFKEEDIDLDGKKEALIALGEIDKEIAEQSRVSMVFLLRNENGIIKKIDEDFGYAYTIFNVKLVSLQGKKQKYISIDLTNDESMRGFSLLELVNNKIETVWYSASPSGSGQDYLVDNNKDGQYDGFVQILNNSDALYYEVRKHYVFKNNTFKSSETHVEIPPAYPYTIEDLLLQYISLRSLDCGESKEVNQQLKLICKDPNISIKEWDKASWAEGYINTYMGFDNKIEFETQQDTYTTTATYIDEEQKQYQCQFELKENNNKWQITKVKMTKNGEK